MRTSMKDLCLGALDKAKELYNDLAIEGKPDELTLISRYSSEKGGFSVSQLAQDVAGVGVRILFVVQTRERFGQGESTSVAPSFIPGIHIVKDNKGKFVRFEDIASADKPSSEKEKDTPKKK